MTELEMALDYLRYLAREPIGEAERTAASRLLVDSIGCALGGAGDDVTLRTSKALGSVADGVGLLGSNLRLRPADALLVHGAAIRCMDFNDIFSRRNNHHPSEFVVPIVLALAELDKWSGARTIDATAIGYRVFLSMGEMWEGMLGRGWAPASTLGRATAAALVGLLRDLDDAVVANAMAIGAITAPTLGVVFKGQLSNTKSLVNGMAARAGWEAVDLALAGITGPLNAFEGPGGYDQMAGGPFIPPDRGEPMLTAADVSLKAFPTIFMTHAAIASAIELSGQVRNKDAIRRVSVRAPEKVVTMTAAEPRWKAVTREEAQFSLPVVIAASVVHGGCGPAELAAEKLADPLIKQVLSIMDVEVDPKWKGYEGGRVEIETGDGETLVAETTVAPGHPNNPMSEAQVLAKFNALAAVGLGEKRADRVRTEIAGLADARDISDLMAASRG